MTHEGDGHDSRFLALLYNTSKYQRFRVTQQTTIHSVVEFVAL